MTFHNRRKEITIKMRRGDKYPVIEINKMLPEGSEFLYSRKEYVIDTTDRQLMIEEFLFDLAERDFTEVRVMFQSDGMYVWFAYQGHVDFIELMDNPSREEIERDVEEYYDEVGYEEDIISGKYCMCDNPKGNKRICGYCEKPVIDKGVDLGEKEDLTVDDVVS